MQRQGLFNGSVLGSFLGLSGLLCLSLTSTSAFAEAPIGKIKQIDGEAQRVAVKLNSTSEVQTGMKLVISNKSGEQCFVNVARIKGPIAIVNVSSCPFAKSLKVGQVVERSLFDQSTPSISEPGRALSPVNRLEAKQPSTRDPSLPTDNEEWYTLWGLGVSSFDYTDDRVDRELDRLDGKTEHSAVNVDLLGFYWPLYGHRTMIGGIINGGAEAWKSRGQTLRVSQSLLSFSAHHFFGVNIGDGWFLRGDLGLAQASVEFEDSDGLVFHSASKRGLGLLLGGGYGFAIGEETRMLIGTYWAHRNVDVLGSDSLMFNLSFLF